MLILVQRPQHKSTSDQVGAPKNNQFGAIFIEFVDTVRNATLFQGLSCMHKGQKCIQTLWDHQKKTPFVKNYKECAICAMLREKNHFGAYPDAKKGVARAQVR